MKATKSEASSANPTLSVNSPAPLLLASEAEARVTEKHLSSGDS